MTMKMSELTIKSKKELEKLASTLREKKRQLRFDLVAGKVKNIDDIKRARKDIARILTVLKTK